MSGKWADSDRKSRLPSDWPALVALTKKRAKGQCQFIMPSRHRCPRKGTDVDHIHPGDDNRPQNLQLLCAAHHALKSSLEGQRAQAARRIRGLRQEETHPGTIR